MTSVNKKLFPLAISPLLLFSYDVNAFEFDASYGQREGEVVYQIGGTIRIPSGQTARVRFPISELRFPVNTTVVNIGFSHQLNDEWSLSASWMENVNSNPDDMIDSDWGIKYYLADPNASRDSLDIYSESQLRMDGTDVSVDLFKKVNWNRFESWDIELGGGMLKQTYNFVAGNTLQEYPSTPSASADYLPGDTIKYEYKSTMLYVALNAAKQLTVDSQFIFYGAYSPKVQVSDFDNHILRNKTSAGDSEGWGTFLKAKFIKNIGRRSSVYILASYQKTVANGIQTQRSYETGSYTEADVGLRNTNVQQVYKIGVNFQI